MVFDLVPATDVQSGLFNAPDTPASQRLMGVVDGRGHPQMVLFGGG